MTKTLPKTLRVLSVQRRALDSVVGIVTFVDLFIVVNNT